jgi:hypothetical protein
VAVNPAMVSSPSDPSSTIVNPSGPAIAEIMNAEAEGFPQAYLSLAGEQYPRPWR